MPNLLRRFALAPLAITAMLTGAAGTLRAQMLADGPYRVVGFNYTERGVYNFVVDGFGAGSVHARQFGGGGGRCAA